MGDSLVPGANGPDQILLAKILAENKAGWDVAWKQNITPWDAGVPQPALQHFINSKAIDLPTSGKALVPGCGKALDAILIASELGVETTAIDISSTAIDLAKSTVESAGLPASIKVEIKEADFFKLNPQQGEIYDVVYDYTFFVAIPPSRRGEWGRQMSSITKPGGYLITLIYPIDKEHSRGPPHWVIPEHYPPVLGDSWEKVYDEAPPSEVSLELHRGRERLVVWKRKLQTEIS